MAELGRGGAGRLAFPGFKDFEEPQWARHKTSWNDAHTILGEFPFSNVASAAVLSNFEFRAMSLKRRLSNDY